MENLKERIDNVMMEIDGHVHHGECFYELDELNDLLKNLDLMKELAIRYQKQNSLEFFKEENGGNE